MSRWPSTAKGYCWSKFVVVVIGTTWLKECLSLEGELLRYLPEAGNTNGCLA
jgi:hypothetical protein